MPIDYKKYPADWKFKISPDILARAENCCENCAVPNSYVILRSKKNKSKYMLVGNNLEKERTSYFQCAEFWKSRWSKPIKVVLTISHTDHDIKHNDYSNLRALCQRCHLLHDKDHHAKTRKLKKEN